MAPRTRWPVPRGVAAPTRDRWPSDPSRLFVWTHRGTERHLADAHGLQRHETLEVPDPSGTIQVGYCDGGPDGLPSLWLQRRRRIVLLSIDPAWSPVRLAVQAYHAAIRLGGSYVEHAAARLVRRLLEGEYLGGLSADGRWMFVPVGSGEEEANGDNDDDDKQ